VAAAAVVLTQPVSRSGPIVDALRGLGVEIACWPLIATAAEPEVDWQALFAELAGSHWAVLPSPAAVAVVMAQAAAHGIAWPSGCGIAVVGQGSLQAVARWYPQVRGLVDARLLIPEGPPWDARRLIAHPVLARLDGQRVAVLRRGDAPDRWEQPLSARGASVRNFVVYRASAIDPPATASDWLSARALEDALTVFCIASADAGRRLAGWVGGLDCASWAMSQPVLTVHPRIADALAESGWRAVHLHRPGVDGLLVGLESLGIGLTE
jgi:uroporphyrinogen-III synthase